MARVPASRTRRPIRRTTTPCRIRVLSSAAVALLVLRSGAAVARVVPADAGAARRIAGLRTGRTAGRPRPDDAARRSGDRRVPDGLAHVAHRGTGRHGTTQ